MRELSGRNLKNDKLR